MSTDSMGSAARMGPDPSVADMLGAIRRKGITLWLEAGRVRYKGPRSALSPEDIERLRMSRREIAELLQDAQATHGAAPPLSAAHESVVAPLTFSQLQHWHMYELHRRRALRHIGSATRLLGRLNVDAFRLSVAAVIRRHDALRTRIIKLDDVPHQVIDDVSGPQLEVHERTGLSGKEREAEIQRHIEQMILDPIDVSAGPLVAVRLLKLDEREHALIVVMEHIISDQVSGGIFLQDLLGAYAQCVSGEPVALPPMPLQFHEYAQSQRAEWPAWLEKHDAYWTERLQGAGRLRFPAGEELRDKTSVGWTHLDFKIERELKAELRAWSRSRRTTIALSVFTAYVALVLRWCQASDTVIQFVSNGRLFPETDRTIGYFAFPLFLRIKLREGDRFSDLLAHVMDEYHRAYEHADFSCREAQLPRPDFARNTDFNWIPWSPALELAELSGSEHALRCSDIPFEHPNLRTLERDTEPFVLLYDGPDHIAGSVYYARNGFSSRTMARFAQNVPAVVSALVTRPEQRVKDFELL